MSGNEHWVEHAGLRLHVWEKGQPGQPILVLAHGSATPGRESFDLQVPGRPTYSLMDALAGAGFDVFAPDLRGFGRSSRPAQGVDTEEAAQDLAAAVDFVLRLRGIPRVHLLAWSWGTQYAGRFVAAHPQKVARYVSYAQMHAASPDLARRAGRIEALRHSPYLDVAQAAWAERFVSMTPAGANDPAVVAAYVAAAMAAGGRVPSGPQLDLLTRMPLVDPERLPVPTLMIHGEHDDVADVEGLLPFFRALPHPDKRYVVVAGGGHMLHLQKPHRRFQRAVGEFLSPED
jgi:pimeloyl-ACP methyl ester carboxylesterase